MIHLSLAAVTKRFGGTLALDAISLDVAEGEFLCLLGPTNAGKSTLLKIVAGLHNPDAGRIAIAGCDVTGSDPADRGVSLLFQNIALFPDRDGFENIAFALRRARTPAGEIRRRVSEVAELLRITHLLDRYPRTYSGGEQQRVAIGRAIARRTDLLLLDEPLSNLDARIRLDLRIEFRRLHRTLGQTVVYVTHDQIEALSLADRVAVLNQGRLQQVADPDGIFDHPTNQFIAEFIGAPPMNLIPASLDLGSERRARIAGEGFSIDLPAGIDPDDVAPDLRIGVRPEAVRVASHAGAETPFPAYVRWVEHHGSRAVLGLEFGGTIIKAIIPPDHPVRAEGPAWLGFGPRIEHLLDTRRDVFLQPKWT
jgi:multiple sugar transport system ATP-binding protein